MSAPFAFSAHKSETIFRKLVKKLKHKTVTFSILNVGRAVFMKYLYTHF